ncbi:DUF362 domain-containing protein [Anaerocolumna sp. AGMB13025]|uniref:DUF362 domain-containing protein n=1 Tax=Anaerocolumna sp. AGMB13025 TaxID=3039116 RepID=UPI00241FEF73|nr:DUF362 domain-containing protein [Anaerocolumna sp. AGMB13025]WFR55122.1 DUF362 domain-containing protein [Anaerocolumna sp. AGMB13025]
MGMVSIVKCEDYEITRVREAVGEALKPLGGMGAFVKPGDKVLLKVNLLMKRKPERVTTTHPAIARVLAELVIDAGGVPIIGDSPGSSYLYTEKVLDSIYETCGMKEAASQCGAELNYNTEMVEVPYHEGKLMKAIRTIKPVLEVDKIINIPKIKTHMMTVYSGAVKNLFGIIPGRVKAEYHLRFEDKNDFADFLIDLCSFAKPVLTVMDAVVGMEGYGPTAGSPKQVGLILAGASPYELDSVAARIIGLKPTEVPTICKSTERGLLAEEIVLAGHTIEEVMVKDYKKPTRQLSFSFYSLILPKFVKKRVDGYIRPKPAFKLDQCKSCGACARSCPPEALTMVEGKPVLDLNKCIRCFCCHELCTYEAVEVIKPWFLKLLVHS